MMLPTMTIIDLVLDFSNDIDVETGYDATQSNVEQPNQEQPRRSTRQRRQPDYFGREHTSLCDVPQQPTSYQEATIWPDKEKWQAAMETEMMLLQDNDVWELVNLPVVRKMVGRKWIYKIKTKSDGSLDC